MTKRIFALLLVLLLALTMVACQPSTQQSSTPDGGAEAPQDDGDSGDSGELERVTLRIILGGPDYSAKERVWQHVSEVCGDRLNADFEVTFFPWGDEYPQKLQLAISSGDDFDTCFDADWWSYNTLVNKGAYLDISELAPIYMPEYYARLEETGNLQACFVGDGMYCVPWEAPFNARPHFVWKDNAVENPVTSFKDGEIQTMEDIDAFLQEAKALNPDNAHLFECSGDYDIVTFVQPKYNMAKWDFHYLTFELNQDTIVVQAEEQTEMFAEAAYWAKKWVDDGVYPRDIKTNTAAHSSLGDDHNYSGFGMFEYIATDENMNDPDYHYSLMYPDGYFVNKSPTNNLMAINKNAANPERILMFYDLLYSDSDVYDAVLYGIEGDTYMIDDTGAYVWAEEGMDQTNTSWMEYTGQWGFWRLEQMKPTGQRSQNCWDLNAEFMENPGNVTSPLAAFVPDPEPIKNELAARDALYSEFGVLIEYGLVDDVDAAIAEYIQMQKDAGLDKIIQEVQAQVDAYMASRQ